VFCPLSLGVESRRGWRVNSGFSLLEMIVVLVIAGMLFAVAPPLLHKAVPGIQTKSAAREMASSLRRARSMAVARQQETWLTVDVEQRRFWLNGDKRRNSIPDEVDVKLFTAQAELIDGEKGRIRFFPQGGSTGGRITLQRGGSAYQIDIDWLTGRVALEPKSV
jgi:general secretion pathway protein H